MRERKETISIPVANMWSIAILFVAAVVACLYYYLIRGEEGCKTDLTSGFGNPVLVMLGIIVVLIVGMVIHEFVHGLVWAHYAEGGWKTISFGVMWKYLAPYCHCDVPLKVPHYRIGALAPLYVVGILPVLVSPFLHSLALLFFGIFFISGAAGDLMVVWKLRKEDPTSMVLDHPSEAGYLVYEEEGS